MRHDIIVVDNFYSDPDAVVRFAHELEYVFPYSQRGTPGASNPTSWRASRYRSARDCVFKSSSQLIARLASLTGDEIDIDSWRREFRSPGWAAFPTAAATAGVIHCRTGVFTRLSSFAL